MYTIDYIVHTNVHKCEYTCAYNVYPVKESGHNNVHVHLCTYMHVHARTCTLYVYYVHTHKVRCNSHNEYLISLCPHIKQENKNSKKREYRDGVKGEETK